MSTASPTLESVHAAYGTQDRRAVCKTCHTVMDDCEPFGGHGEFYHKTTFGDGKLNKCKNAGKTFYGGDAAIEPFMRKGTRRRARRLGVR